MSVCVLRFIADGSLAERHVDLKVVSVWSAV
jgi:hypothetical protein